MTSIAVDASPVDAKEACESPSTMTPTGVSRTNSGDFTSEENTPVSAAKGISEDHMNPSLWYIHGHAYDLSDFVDKHPGGRLALLSGRGRDCTALFESYHPWNDNHRKVLKAHGKEAPPPDPFYEEIKQEVRKVFPGGGKTTKMRTISKIALSAMWVLMVTLFFVVRSPISCLFAGFLMGTIGTRLAHEGAHWQISQKEWVNRMALFLGYFLTGPSLAWHYRHVISHHAHTNQEKDVDVEYIWIADMLPGWLKILALPFVAVGAVFELGPKSIFDLCIMKRMGGGNRVFWDMGGLWLEVPIWILVHWFLGPSWLCYVCMYFTAGAVFVPCSQVAHAIVYPSPREHKSWAQMQIAESVDFATDSDFWFHLAFGLTTQCEHHLFPGIGHHCYDRIRLIVREVCKKHGVVHLDLPASKAFGALWHRWVMGTPMPLA